MKEIAIRELRKKLKIAQKEKNDIQLNVEKFEHASKSLNKLIDCQIVDNFKKGLSYDNYNVVPPPYTGKFIPPTPELSYTGLDEFVNKPVVENYKTKSSEEEPKASSCWVWKPKHKVLDYVSKHNSASITLKMFDYVDAQGRSNSKLMLLGITYYCWVNVNVVEVWSTAAAKTINEEAQLHAYVNGKKIIITEASIRRDLQLDDEECVDCLPNSTIIKELALMGAWNEFNTTMASAIICLAINQKFNFSKWIFDSMIRNLDNVSGKFLMYPRKPTRKVTYVPQLSDPIEHVTDEAVHKELEDSLVRAATTASSLGAYQDRGNIAKTQSKATPNESSSHVTDSGGGPRVLELEKTKTTQHNEIASLKRRVKKLEKMNSLGEEASKQERIETIDLDEDITLVNDQDDADKDMFDVNVLGGEEVFATAGKNENVVNITTKELTLSQALKALKTSKPKVKGIVIQEQEEPEPVKPKKKDQIRLDEEAAKKLQAKFNEEERLAREKA
nr:hypothetical protein [Tanacetum cinerariifolium]